MKHPPTIQSLYANKLLLTYEEWWELNRISFEWLPNIYNPHILYIEYTIKTIAEYIK